MGSFTWSGLGSVPPRELFAARLAQHIAAQPMTAAAYALLAMRDDHCHTNLLWSEERAALLGRPLTSGVRCFLDPARLRTGLLEAGGREVFMLSLPGLPLADVFTELARGLAQAGEPPSEGLSLPEYDLPDAPFTRGEPFPEPDAAFEELAHWFANGHHALREVATLHLDGAEVRGWPHHFDLAALRTLDADADPEKARSVGVGLSPGDGTYAEPYFYVTPWPAPEASALPALPEGMHWHTEGFTSAVLTGSELVRWPAEAQRQKLLAALNAAVAACYALLGETDAGGAVYSDP